MAIARQPIDPNPIHSLFESSLPAYPTSFFFVASGACLRWRLGKPRDTRPLGYSVIPKEVRNLYRAVRKHPRSHGPQPLESGFSRERLPRDARPLGYIFLSHPYKGAPAGRRNGHLPFPFYILNSISLTRTGRISRGETSRQVGDDRYPVAIARQPIDPNPIHSLF